MAPATCCYLSVAVLALSCDVQLYGVDVSCNTGCAPWSRPRGFTAQVAQTCCPPLPSLVCAGPVFRHRGRRYLLLAWC
eukprot:3189501-Amphidinium_carterae.1